MSSLSAFSKDGKWRDNCRACWADTNYSEWNPVIPTSSNMINGTEISKNGLAAAFLIHNTVSLTFSKMLSLISALKLKKKYIYIYKWDVQIFFIWSCQEGEGDLRDRWPRLQHCPIVCRNFSCWVNYSKLDWFFWWFRITYIFHWISRCLFYCPRENS